MNAIISACGSYRYRLERVLPILPRRSSYRQILAGMGLMPDELTRLREDNARLRGALEPFVRAWRACGKGEFGPIRFYTDEGYREIPVQDFERAALAHGKG